MLKDLGLLMATEKWPYHPVLPMIKLTKGPGISISGIVTAREVKGEGPIRVYYKNIYELISGLLEPQLESCEFEEFDNADELLEAWRVD